ncbi:MAG: alpha/beta hydrolase [Pseudomonadota bacterium]|nr:alpha/beta hydrolase [Pseudomonadota bacterium]
MASTKRKFARHLGEAARQALAACRTYPTAHVLLNPLTRPLAMQVAHSDWRATLKQIDFPYTIEDATIGGVACARYRTLRTESSNPLILYLHAGAFVSGSPRVNAAAVLPACELSGCEAIGVDYTLAPNAVYPTQLEQIERVYRALIEQGRSPSSIVVMGDSAGGTLALASVARWRAAGLPAPAGLITLSAVTDCAGDSDTHLTLAHHDPIFGGHALEGVHAVVGLYAPGVDRRDPGISPLYGDYAGGPPMLIHVGSRDVLLGDSARLAERARRAGVDVSLRVFDGMFHLFHMHWSLEDARAAFEDIAHFIARNAKHERRAGAAA